MVVTTYMILHGYQHDLDRDRRLECAGVDKGKFRL